MSKKTFKCRIPLLQPSTNERGMALVTAMLILVALTLLMVTAMTNTTIDTMIAGNDYKSQQKFYATEGAEELVLSALPDLISGSTVCHDSYGNPITCNDQYGSPITTLNQLLGYDKNGNGKFGDITPLLYSYLKNQDINEFCNPGGTSGQYMYSVHVEDDVETGDSYPPDRIDKNNEIYLISTQTDSIKGTTTDLISYTLKLLLIKHDGAVNLIDKDGGVSINMLGANSLVDGGVNKEGIVTTDMLTDFSSISTTQVMPNGVVQRFNQFVNPSIKDLHDVMYLLTNNRTPLKEGYPIALGTNDANGNPSATIYVRGDVTITGDISNKVLIIGDYYDPVTAHYQIGLHIESNVTFNGLIILLPDHDLGSSAIPITLSNGAKINGAIVASSLFDPNNLKSGPGIDLTLNNNAKIKYDYSKIVSTGFERQFAVLNRNYLPY